MIFFAKNVIHLVKKVMDKIVMSAMSVIKVIIFIKENVWIIVQKVANKYYNIYILLLFLIKIKKVTIEIIKNV